MRLVYGVLLPGVIIFVSSGNLLYARAVEGDETNVVARRFLQHVPAAATVKEAGSLTKLIDFVKELFEKPLHPDITIREVKNVLTRVQTTKTNNGENYADLAVHARKAYRNHLRAVLNQWKKSSKEKTESFMGSTEYKDFCALVREANRYFPKEHAFDEYTLIKNSLRKNKFKKIVLKGYANNDANGAEYHKLLFP
uniref:RxLR effector candidate protein n=1 Tax=Hyaloperonospora arabidopsidis (strain Emoy2) TaxID=559515 RepID=M4BF43_HYAAE|nr:RxLR effector candidate protein [Hyaloperonospora arabidopsidis Emoy2]